MQKTEYKTLKETLYHQTMSNGLEVFLLKKEGFSKTYGIFATRFGSVDTSFVPLGQKEMIKVPDGVAHFLEHKMFEMENGDAIDLFSNLGASTNAFTSSTRTAYLFSTSSKELECTKLLLDFVQDLYLTEENVEKEKGIIGQEIKMYDDDPDWQNYFGAIQNLYHHHPISVDIAGTVETVNATTMEALEMCYHTFYHPSNMVLFVVGHIEPETMMQMIEENQNAKHFEKPQPIIREKIDEPRTVAKQETIQYMDVAIPKLTMAIKVDNVPDAPLEKLKRELSCNIILDYLFSKSGDLYEEWTKDGLINDSFGGFFTQERDYAFIQMGGDTFHVEELKKALQTLVGALPEKTLPKSDFERLKRQNIGNMIMLFNSPESIANLFIRYYFENISAFELIDALDALTYDDVMACLKLFDLSKSSMHIVLPKKENL